MLTELKQKPMLEYNMEKTHLPITTGLQNCGRSALTSFTSFYLVLWGATEVLQVISQFRKPAKRYRQMFPERNASVNENFAMQTDKPELTKSTY